MSLTQWKAYFSMHVLGQTDSILNPSRVLDSGWAHQSCPWFAVVENFKYKAASRYFWKQCHRQVIAELKEVLYTEDEYCRDCGENSRAWVCEYCESDYCRGCGERGCGSYHCSVCRRDSRWES